MMKKIFILSLFIFVGFSCSNDDDNSNDADVSELAGVWSGTFTGDDTGTWTVNITDNGEVSGTAYSAVFDQDLVIIGQLGVNGDLTATLGGTDSGSTFNGNLNADGQGNGSWENKLINTEGTWTGSKE